MTQSTLISVSVHVNLDTPIEAEKFTDFVSLKVGGVEVFLINSEQASRLAEAAEKAYVILKEMERPSQVDQMLAAGEAWIRAIDGRDVPGGARASMLGWQINDWDVVLKRHGSGLHPTDTLVAQFRAKYDRSTA